MLGPKLSTMTFRFIDSKLMHVICLNACLVVFLRDIYRMDGGEEDEMTLWNEIATDFDPEEETANFGTRRALEADGNLYEVKNYNIEVKFEQTNQLGDHLGHH